MDKTAQESVLSEMQDQLDKYSSRCGTLLQQLDLVRSLTTSQYDIKGTSQEDQASPTQTRENEAYNVDPEVNSDNADSELSEDDIHMSQQDKDSLLDDLLAQMSKFEGGMEQYNLEDSSSESDRPEGNTFGLSSKRESNKLPTSEELKAMPNTSIATPLDSGLSSSDESTNKDERDKFNQLQQEKDLVSSKNMTTDNELLSSPIELRHQSASIVSSSLPSGSSEKKVNFRVEDFQTDFLADSINPKDDRYNYSKPKVNYYNLADNREPSPPVSHKSVKSIKVKSLFTESELNGKQKGKTHKPKEDINFHYNQGSPITINLNESPADVINKMLVQINQDGSTKESIKTSKSKMKKKGANFGKLKQRELTQRTIKSKRSQKKTAFDNSSAKSYPKLLGFESVLQGSLKMDDLSAKHKKNTANKNKARRLQNQKSSSPMVRRNTAAQVSSKIFQRKRSELNVLSKKLKPENKTENSLESKNQKVKSSQVKPITKVQNTKGWDQNLLSKREKEKFSTELKNESHTSNKYQESYYEQQNVKKNNQVPEAVIDMKGTSGMYNKALRENLKNNTGLGKIKTQSTVDVSGVAQNENIHNALSSLSTKLRSLDRIKLDKIGFNTIPFVVGSSIGRSHHLGLNIQHTLSLFKRCHSPLNLEVIIPKSGMTGVNSSETTFSRGSLYTTLCCPAIANGTRENEMAFGKSDDGQDRLLFGPSESDWKPLDPSDKGSSKCSCLPRKRVNYCHVLNQLLNNEMCFGLARPPTLSQYSFLEEGGSRHFQNKCDNDMAAHKILNSKTNLTKLLRRIQEIQGKLSN